MIQVIYENGQFLVKGTFSLGIAGVFENKEFGQEQIEIDGELEDILDELKDENSFSYEPLFPYLKDKGEDGAAIAKGLEEYYNQKEKEIEENVKQINDCILYHLFENLEACGYPFWEIEEAIIPGSLANYDMEQLEAQIYDTEESVYDWESDYYEKPNNGTMQKIDVEGKLRKMYPMFNFDGLYQSIVPEGICLSGRFMEFQFSDGWGAQLLECAYDRFDENFTSCDWHNH